MKTNRIVIGLLVIVLSFSMASITEVQAKTYKDGKTYTLKGRIKKVNFQILVFPTLYDSVSWNVATPQNDNYHLKQKNYAEAKHRTNSATTNATRLLR